MDKAAEFDKAESDGKTEADRLRDENEKLRAKLTAKDTEIDGIRLDFRKRELLAAKGLDYDKWSKRITATTEEELVADIDDLAAMVAPPAEPPAPVGGSVQPAGGANSTPDYTSAESMTMEQYAEARRTGALT